MGKGRVPSSTAERGNSGNFRERVWIGRKDFVALREEHRWCLASVFIHLHISSYIFNLKMMQQFLPKPVNVNQLFEDSKVCFHGQKKKAGFEGGQRENHGSIASHGRSIIPTGHDIDG